MASPELIVITCASGKQCTHLIPHLYSNPSYGLRLVVHSMQSKARLSSNFPTAEVVTANMCEPADCRSVLAGATAVYHVGPAFHHHETALGYNMIDAAVEESQGPSSMFKHFVYSSVLNTQHRKLMNHDCKRYVEEYLMESGLTWTILQPTNFMDVWPIADFLQAKDMDITFPCFWNRKMPNAQIALTDLGEAAAKVLKERERHYYAQYPLASIMPASFAEATQIIGDVIGKNITPQERSLHDSAQILQEICGQPDPSKVPRLTRDAALRLPLWYEEHSLNGNPNVLRWLLGREPTSLKNWAEMQVEQARQAAQS